jgi:hypothetical protein
MISLRNFIENLVLCAVMALGVTVSTQGASAQTAVSVAVLPFANTSGDTDQDALADGLTRSRPRSRMFPVSMWARARPRSASRRRHATSA